MCKFERKYEMTISHIILTKTCGYLETWLIYSKSIDVILQETAYIAMTSGAFEVLIKIAFGIVRSSWWKIL